MSAEPEDVAAVQGGNPEPCPTCGGLCREKLLGAMGAGLIKQYEPLVKGEVVAEATVDEEEVKRWNNNPNRDRIALCLWTKGSAAAGDIPVLVFRAACKENAGTGGKE